MQDRDAGALAATVGLGLVAASGALLIAAGPRLVGHTDYGSLAIAWTFSTIFGLGVATPTEQLINRQSNALGRHAPGRAVLVLLLAGAVGVLVALALGHRAASGGNGVAIVVSSVVALVGWIACALLRGRALGHQDLRGYALSQTVEGGSRVLLTVVAFALPELSLEILFAAVGVPLLLSAAWTWWRIRHTAPGRGADDPRTEHLSFVLVALGYQACLSGPVLLLGWRIGAVEPELIGAFVLASSVFRAPAVAAGGTFVGGMTSLSRAWGAADADAFASGRRRMVLQVVLFTVLASALISLVAPFVLPLLYGGSLRLPLEVYLGLILSTVVAVVANAFTVALLAAERGSAGAIAWLAGASCTVALLLFVAPTWPWITTALVVGPVVTLVLVAARRGPRTVAVRPRDPGSVGEQPHH